MNTGNPRPRRVVLPALLLSVCSICATSASTWIRADDAGTALPGFWVDDDLQQGLSRAREAEKPLLIVFRCPP